MEVVSRRDYFAASADIAWIKDATAETAFRRTGVEIPSGTPETNPQQWVRFFVKVEIAWRWRYADLMLKGSDSINGG